MNKEEKDVLQSTSSGKYVLSSLITQVLYSVYAHEYLCFLKHGKLHITSDDIAMLLCFVNKMDDYIAKENYFGVSAS